MKMNDFEKQIWASTYSAEYVRCRNISERLYSENSKIYMHPREAGIEYTAAKIAQEAVEKYRKLKEESEDFPYYFLIKKEKP